MASGRASGSASASMVSGMSLSASGFAIAARPTGGIRGEPSVAADGNVQNMHVLVLQLVCSARALSLLLRAHQRADALAPGHRPPWRRSFRLRTRFLNLDRQHRIPFPFGSSSFFAAAADTLTLRLTALVLVSILLIPTSSFREHAPTT